MKKYLLVTIVPLYFFLAIGCKREVQNPDNYFTQNEKAELLVQFTTFIYKLPPKATLETRSSPLFKSYYTKSASLFTWEYHQVKLDTHYFYLIRPAGNDPKYVRGVGGKFTLKPNSLEIEHFEEIFNTPRLQREEVKEKGTFLFKQLVKTGNVNHLLEMKHYIEWPDNRLNYDRKSHSWVVRETK